MGGDSGGDPLTTPPIKLLVEKRILVISDNVEDLLPVILSLKSLLFPFQPKNIE